MISQTYSQDTEDDSELSLTCEDDCCSHEHEAVFHCVECASSYCTDCWSRQRPHKSKKNGQSRMGHEKASVQVVTRLTTILHPARDPNEIARLHLNDRANKWISVSQQKDRSFVVRDHGRLAALLSFVPRNAPSSPAHPHLISFLGPTNAGKSTIIKMLLGHNRNTKELQTLTSPIVGSLSHDSTPTSGDIHLYADPKTAETDSPLLYADCESSGSPECIPIGAFARLHKDVMDTGDDSADVRPLSWTIAKKTYQRHSVTQLLYSRLLYTFSDCVVFVTRNPRSFQSVTLLNILEWGAMSLERSLNHPVLPHCIVVFNGVDPASDSDDWDIERATKKLLSSIDDTLQTVQNVKRLAEHWRSLGKGISTLQDLILCFYSSFKVIRIPTEPRYMVIDAQIGKLHSLVQANCAEAIKGKRSAHLPIKARNFVGFINSGLAHFSSTLNVPFSASVLSDKGGRMIHLCALATALQSPHQLKSTITLLFEKLTTLLASCVMVEGVRCGTTSSKHLLTIYREVLQHAMDEFLALDSPCGHTSKSGSRRCQLVRDRHGIHGHQDERGIIAHGDYEPSFTTRTLTNLWKTHPKSPMETLHRQFRVYAGEHGTNETDVAANMHQTHLQRFRDSIGPAAAQDAASTCFCYLLVPVKAEADKFVEQVFQPVSEEVKRNPEEMVVLEKTELLKSGDDVPDPDRPSTPTAIEAQVQEPKTPKRAADTRPEKSNSPVETPVLVSGMSDKPRSIVWSPPRPTTEDVDVDSNLADEVSLASPQSNKTEETKLVRMSTSDDAVSEFSVSVYEDAVEVSQTTPKSRGRDRPEKYWSWVPRDDESHQSFHRSVRSISSISSTMSQEDSTLLSDHTDIDEVSEEEIEVAVFPTKTETLNEKLPRLQVRQLSVNSLESLQSVLSSTSPRSQRRSRRISRLSFASTTIDSTPISPIDGNEDIIDEGYAGSIHSAHGVRMSRSLMVRKILLDRRVSRAMV